MVVHCPNIEINSYVKKEVGEFTSLWNTDIIKYPQMKHLCLFWQQILNTILYSQAQFFIHKTTIIYNYS